MTEAADYIGRLRKDAERYRWLRDKSLGQWSHPIAVSQERAPETMRYFGPLCGKELDEAIDTALLASNAYSP